MENDKIETKSEQLKLTLKTSSLAPSFL